MTDHRARFRAAARNLRGDGWYAIRAAAGPGDGEAESAATVDLYDEIGGWCGVTAADFRRDVNALDVDRLDVHINSPGGDAFEGIAILNTLRQHPARVVVTVDGLAASAASLIAMAGDEIRMARNSEMMIHDAWGLCVGPAEDMRDLAERLDKLSDNVASAYAERGGTVEDWRAAMLAESWYSAQEAVDAGLADRVLTKDDDGGGDRPTSAGSGAPTKARAYDLSMFAYAGRRQAPDPPMPAPRAASAGRGKHVHRSFQAAQAADRSTPVAPVTLSDELVDQLRQHVGFAADADPATIVAAVGEAMSEQAEDTKPLPGTVAVDAAVLEQLQADASAGRAARDQQQADARERLVDAAVRDGRITPASREDYLAALADPVSGARHAERLAALPKGLIPVDEPIGYATEPAGDATPADGDAAAEAVRNSDVYKNWKV